MIEKGIVLKISSKLAAVRLNAISGITPANPPLSLEAECPDGISPGKEATVLLSPGHPLQLLPWELAAGVVILAVFTLSHHIFIGSGLAHLFLFFCFSKIRARKISFRPQVLKSL